MNKFLLSTALLVAIGAAPARAANTAITVWNAANPGGAETAEGTGNASLAVQNLGGVTISLSDTLSSDNPNELSEGNIDIDNTDASTQTLKIIVGANGFPGPSSNFALTGTIGVTLGQADLGVQYFVDGANTLNGVSTGPVIGVNIGAFDSGTLTGPQSFSDNLSGANLVSGPYGLAEELTLTLAPGAEIFVQGASMEAFEAVPGPVVGAGLPGLILGAFAIVGLNRRRRRFRG